MNSSVERKETTRRILIRGENGSRVTDGGREAPQERAKSTLTDARLMNPELNWPLMNLECASSVPKQ